MIACGYADLPDGQLHYRQRAAPDGATPALFLHQTASSSRMWVSVMQRLAPDRRLIALDTPGFGFSFDPPGMPDMPRYAGWVLAAADSLGLESFHLVGHHTGVCIAAELACLAPRRVRSVAMIGPVPLTEAERAAFRTQYSTPFAPDADGAYLTRTWDYLAGLSADSALDLHHREAVDTLRAWHGRFQAYSAVWDQDFTALFMRIACPLLLMCGTGDVLMPYFERARSLRPDARSLVLSCSNFEPDQDPDATSRALQDFLASHPD